MKKKNDIVKRNFLVILIGIIIFFGILGSALTIDELDDVYLTDINDGDILQYDSDNSSWNNSYFPFYITDTTIGTDWELKSDYGKALGTYNDWSYYVKYTIDKDFIDSDLVNFPIRVNSSDSVLISKCQNDGGDLRFVSDNNLTEYYYEIESFESNYFDVWVNITSVSSSVDTVFLMYYGNAGVSNGESPNDVWDSNFVTVLHFGEGVNGTASDSTVYGNDGTPGHGDAVGSTDPDQTVSGQVGYGIDFDGLCSATTYGGYMDMADSPSLSIDDNITIEFFTNYHGSTGSFNYITGSKYLDGEWVFYTNPGGYWGFTRNTAGTYFDKNINEFIGSWKHYTIVSENGVGNNLYIDSTIDIITAPYLVGLDTAYNKRIGGRAISPDDRSYDGMIDEFRISNIARNSSWVKASYNSQYQSVGFLTSSSEFEYTISQVSKNYTFNFDDINNTLSMDFLIDPLGYIGAGVSNPFNQDLNTTDDVNFDDITLTCGGDDGSYIKTENIDFGAMFGHIPMLRGYALDGLGGFNLFGIYDGIYIIGDTNDPYLTFYGDDTITNPGTIKYNSTSDGLEFFGLTSDTTFDSGINASGDIEFSGDLVGDFLYGEMYAKGNDIVTTIHTQSIYHNISHGVTQGFLNGFTYNNANLTCLNDGFYYVSLSASINGWNNKEYHISVAIDGIRSENVHAQLVVDGSNDDTPISCTGILSINASSVVNMVVENVDGVEDATVHDMNLCLYRIGV